VKPGSYLAAAFVSSLLAHSATVRADPRVGELAYEWPADLDGCPDEAALRLAVIGRLRRDPFVRSAQRKILVRITRSNGSLVAVVSVEEAGESRGQRRIETRAGCAELASAAALAVSIAVDPVAGMGDPNDIEETKPEPAPVPKAKSGPPPPGVKLALPPIAREAQYEPFVRVAARGWAGAVPSLGAGPSLGVGFRRGAWSVALDALAVFPEKQSVAGTTRAITVGLFAAQLSPCIHAANFRGCALLTSGALFAQGRGVAQPRSEWSWHATAGMGTGYSFFAGKFSFTPLVEVALRLETAQLSISDQLVWTTPRALAAFGVELGYSLGP